MLRWDVLTDLLCDRVTVSLISLNIATLAGGKSPQGNNPKGKKHLGPWVANLEICGVFTSLS